MVLDEESLLIEGNLFYLSRSVLVIAAVQLLIETDTVRPEVLKSAVFWRRMETLEQIVAS